MLRSGKISCLTIVLILIMTNMGPVGLAGAEGSPNATRLTSLSIHSNNFNYSFYMYDLYYYATIPNDVSSVSVAPVAADNQASISVDGIRVASGSLSENIQLKVGANLIKVLVTAQNGDQKSYDLHINRQPPAPPTLTALRFDSGSLNPNFSPSVTSYTAVVNAERIVIFPVASIISGQITVNNEIVVSGKPSSPVELVMGLNNVVITVKSADGYYSTYNIKVTRQGSGIPTVTTTPATSIFDNTAVLNGNIESNNGDQIINYGFYFSTDQSQWSQVYNQQTHYLGAFSYQITGLKGSTTYYYKAFAQNTQGLSYGLVSSFVTEGRNTSPVMPLITPDGGLFKSPQVININDETPGARIKYTLDGTNPTTSETGIWYDQPFLLSRTGMIKAAAYSSISQRWSMINSVIVNIGDIYIHDFNDVSNNYWAYPAINNFVGKGYIKGNPNGSFEPDRYISRGEFTVILAKALGLNSNSFLIHFYDVRPQDWYYYAIESAYLAGIIAGHGNVFEPDRSITREELAAVMANALGKKEEAMAAMNIPSEFTDDKLISSWARGYVVIASKYGLVSGYPEDNAFRPCSYATRAESVVIINNYLEHYRKQ